MRRHVRPLVFRLGCLLLAAAGAGSSGCLLAVAGAAAGGALGYAYYQGEVDRDFVADYADTHAAVRHALADLHMPVVRESYGATSGTLESQTADRERVEVHLEVRPSRVPADGKLTRVGVRVATFGDKSLSERILAQVGAHLAYSPVGPPRPAPSEPTPSQALQTGARVQPSQTAPPPLAGP